MMILSLTAGLAACGLAGEGSQAAAKDAGVQRYAWPLGSSSPEDTVTQIYAEKFADEVGRENFCANIDASIARAQEIELG